MVGVTTTMIELRGVTKRFGEAAAVDDLSLAFEKGRTTALIGPSGCGKSTTLRLIVGLVAPDAGEVVVSGEPVHRGNLLAIRRRMGYVIQDGGLFPHLTARGNIALMARHLGRDAGWIESRLDELIELTRFPADGLGRYPVELSGGQRQRVSLMRGLMLDPDVLLLDEPLGALDPVVHSELQEQLRDIFSRLNKTVVLVTHDLAEAAYLASDIVLMRDGGIEQRGSGVELAQQPASDFVRRFVTAQRGHAEALSGGSA